MKIKQLTLHNIQCFKNEKIDFSDKINLIVGKNNTGKSAILRSLLNFQQGGNHKRDELIRKFEKRAYVFATISDSKPNPTLKKLGSEDEIAILFDSSKSDLSWMHFSSKLDRGDILQFANHMANNGQLLNIQAYPDSEPDNVFLPFLAKRKTQYTQGQFDEQSVRRIDNDFRNLPTKLSRARSNTLSTEFEKACLELLGFVPSVLPGQQNMNLAMMGQYVGPDESISLDQMGDGVAQMVGLLVNLFQARKKIFIIEEVENDIHPEALKKLLSLIIKSAEHNQFIISTHSNIVIRVLGSESNTKIFETRSELVKDNAANTSIFTSTISEIDNSEDERIRILFDLGYELIDSHMWDGYLITEESSAEMLVFNFLIPCFAPKLVGRLRTIAANGSGDVPRKYSNLDSLFTYINTSKVYKNKAWVLVDGDPAGVEVITKLQDGYEKNWAKQYFKSLSKTNLEEYYPKEYENDLFGIISESDKRKRGKLKLDLAKKIVSQYYSDPKEISRLFEQSASEIIDFLKSIELALSSK